MRRAGCDENNLQPEDFLCDFCGSTWAEDRPMVEGHRGSLICGRCLALAFDEAWNLGRGGAIADGRVCTLCLERRDEPHWAAPALEAWACKRCIKQSAVMMERDEQGGWKRPAVKNASKTGG